MTSIRRILVAIKDPAARSVPALTKAAQLARSLNARLELFHAISWPLYASPYLYSVRSFEQLQQQLHARVLERLERLAAAIHSRGRQRQLRVSVAAEWDLPAYEAIIRRARSTQADLIVAEPHHGRRFLPLLHFNDWELLRQSPIPVLLMKQRRLYSHPVVLAAVDPMNRHDPGTRLDTAILDLSRTLTEALGGKLHAIHAYTPLPSGRMPTDALDAESAARLNQQIATSAQQRYSALLRRYVLPNRRRHLLAMPAAAAIEKTARETRSDIVTLGVVARGGWRRLLVGRTAQLLLDRLSCDLLVVKPAQFKVTIDRRPSGPIYLPLPTP